MTERFGSRDWRGTQDWNNFKTNKGEPEEQESVGEKREVVELETLKREAVTHGLQGSLGWVRREWMLKEG